MCVCAPRHTGVGVATSTNGCALRQQVSPSAYLGRVHVDERLNAIEVVVAALINLDGISKVALARNDHQVGYVAERDGFAGQQLAKQRLDPVVVVLNGPLHGKLHIDHLRVFPEARSITSSAALCRNFAYVVFDFILIVVDHFYSASRQSVASTLRLTLLALPRARFPASLSGRSPLYSSPSSSSARARLISTLNECKKNE